MLACVRITPDADPRSVRSWRRADRRRGRRGLSRRSTRTTGQREVRLQPLQQAYPRAGAFTRTARSGSRSATRGLARGAFLMNNRPVSFFFDSKPIPYPPFGSALEVDLESHGLEKAVENWTSCRVHRCKMAGDSPAWSITSLSVTAVQYGWREWRLSEASCMRTSSSEALGPTVIVLTSSEGTHPRINATSSTLSMQPCERCTSSNPSPRPAPVACPTWSVRGWAMPGPGSATANARSVAQACSFSRVRAGDRTVSQRREPPDTEASPSTSSSAAVSSRCLAAPPAARAAGP